MRIFRRRKGGQTVGGAFVVGRVWKDIALDVAVEAVEEGYLNAGIALLGETHRDPELRSLRLDALSRAAVGRSQGIAELLDGSRDRADILLWLGRTVIDEAWAIRGGSFAESIGEDRYKMFFATLSGAHDPLMEAARLRPDDPVPWESMIWFAMGMQFDRVEEEVIWEETVSRSDTLFSAHWARLQALTEKWGGSHEEMFAHARDAVAIAPAGHPLTAMLALAHLEHLLAEERRLVLENKMMAYVRFGMKYFSEQVVDELKEAERRWTAHATPHPRDLEAHHLFGAIFMRETTTHDLAARHLRQVGNRVGRGAPWSYQGDPAEELAAAMRKLRIPLPASDA
ncbi:hypothetical protein AB0395_04815 [Streptosporangium sp. NPDC051023]|uniref:hypothetical protein n=1 Tax=Streptosporangium sp. NPDC051023 TaxID=3155410 RepID=UPI00344D1136